MTQMHHITPASLSSGGWRCTRGTCWCEERSFIEFDQGAFFVVDAKRLVSLSHFRIVD